MTLLHLREVLTTYHVGQQVKRQVGAEGVHGRVELLREVVDVVCVGGEHYAHLNLQGHSHRHYFARQLISSPPVHSGHRGE